MQSVPELLILQTSAEIGRARNYILLIHGIYPEKKDLQFLAEDNPMGKIASPNDIANTAL
ncbi:MAG: hypothetical protein KDK96_02940 [Chlamydiia bacterium]|nr:hypothetical protein [Chlamydiia bacterium]